jgi:hypothetical protein
VAAHYRLRPHLEGFGTILDIEHNSCLGAIFMLTSMLTLFSQLLGKRTTPGRMGIVTGCFAFGLKFDRLMLGFC